MPPKRKAKDTVSPTRPAPSRARSARPSKASAASDDNESDIISARPPKRARVASSRAAKQNADSDDDDFGAYGRASSKPATIEQHLMDQNKKSKAFIQGFKEQVAQARERVHETLARLKQELSKPSHDPASNDSLPSASEIYTTLQTAAAAEPSSLSTKDNPLFEQTQTLLRLSRAILACHRTAGRDSRSRAENVTSPRETWTQDEEGMRKLLEYGRLYGERVVEGWITPRDRNNNDEDESSTDGEDKEAMSEAENLARGLFEWRRKGRGIGLKGDESWGVAARRQMVALAGVVRTLPSKGE